MNDGASHTLKIQMKAFGILNLKIRPAKLRLCPQRFHFPNSLIPKSVKIIRLFVSAPVFQQFFFTQID